MRDTGAERASDDVVPVQRIGWLLVGVQALLLLAFILLPKRRGLALPPDVLDVIGIVLMIGGLAAMLIALLGLGGALTATPVPTAGAALRTKGVYGVVRHPIYVGILIAALGFTIAVGSVWQVIVLLVLVVFFYGKAFWEDRLLAERHGVTWFDYADHVGGFVPRLRGNR